MGLLPGAARGPSKQWPPDHFIAVGRQLAARPGCRIVVFGARDEASLCRAVAEGIGPAAITLGGETTLSELAALLGLCRVVVANDSGGMHLAAAAGARVVAVYGLTDPAKTGPIGHGHRIVCAEGRPRSRDIRRNSREAKDALASIRPDRVLEAVMELLERGPLPRTSQMSLPLDNPAPTK